MMHREDFLALLEETIKKPLTESQIGQMDIIIADKDYRVAWDKSPYVRPEVREQDAFYNSITFHKLEDVKNLRVSNGWLYDRKLKLFIHGMYGGHEIFAGTLYGILNDDDGYHEDLAEKYVNENCGCYVSRTMNMFIPIKADTFSFTDEEIILDSSKVRGTIQWRGIK